MVRCSMQIFLGMSFQTCRAAYGNRKSDRLKVLLVGGYHVNIQTTERTHQ